MRNFFGYLRALRNYFRTEKARHDFWDELRAAAIISATILIALAVFELIRLVLKAGI